jgi:hypothetical protein
MARHALAIVCAATGCTFVDPLSDLSRGGADVADARTGPAFDYVQDNWAAPQTSQTSVSVAFTRAQTAGGMNVVAIGWNSVAESVASVTDSSGNTYAPATDIVRGATTSQVIYVAPHIKAGQNTVAVQFTAPALDPDVRMIEYSGGAGDPIIAQTVSGSGAGPAASAGPVATSGQRELVFAAAVTHGLFVSADNGFAKRIITTPDGDIVADLLSTSAGSLTAAATLNAPDEWIMQVVVFREP